MFNWIKEIKYRWQRSKRGYADCDWWSFHAYLTDLIIPNIRKLKDNVNGCPGDLYDKERVNDECHKWKEILEEIAQGFEAAKFLDGFGYHKWVDSETHKGAKTLKIDEESINNAYIKMQRGLELFKQYYVNLWD